MDKLLDSLRGLKEQGFPVDQIAAVITEALRAADPFDAVEKHLLLRNDNLTVGEDTYQLYPETRLIVVSLGKASLAMTDAAVQQLGDKITRGVCVCKHLPSSPGNWQNIQVIQGSHPSPDHRSVTAGQSIKEVVAGLNDKDLVVFLVSGGGSSLACLPADGIALEDIQLLTNKLLKSGASINQLNCVRKHLDDLKGGGLLKLAAPARIAALVISDVVGNPLDVIASGPAVADPTTFKETIEILNRFVPNQEVPRVILERLPKGVRGEVPETLKPGDPLLTNAIHTIIASNSNSANSGAEKARSLGFTAVVLPEDLVGDSKTAGEYLAGRALLNLEKRRPHLEIVGGETTVKVTGNGLGGRNLEVALAAVGKLADKQKVVLITIATDGEDGPTDAAGAFVTGQTLRQAEALGTSPTDFMRNNDSYHFFEKVGGLIITGPTGTNVNDLSFIFQF